MTKFLSAEFIRRKFVVHYCHAEIFSVGQEPNPSEVGKTGGASPDVPKIFGGAATLPSKTPCHSLLATRYLLFAIRCRLGLVKHCHPNLFTDSKSVATKMKPAKAG